MKVATFVFICIFSVFCVAAYSGTAPADPCVVGNELQSVLCDGQRRCITHAWLTHDAPDSACSDPLSIDWPEHPLDDERASPADAPALLELLRGAWRNRTVVFDGDSVMEEQWAMTRCMLRALGLMPLDAPMCPPERAGLRADNYVDRCEAPPVGTPDAATAFYARVRAVPSERWNGRSPRNAMYVPSTGTLIVRKGFGEFDAVEFAELLAVSDIIISGYGLHYPQTTHEDAYERDMRVLVRQATVGRARVYIKEVSAQHFRGSGAFESWDQAHPKRSEIASSCSCEPMNATVLNNNYIVRQNAVLRRLASENGIQILPFYDASAARYDLKVGARCTVGWAICACDCTHSCITASFWRGIYAQWLTVIEKKEHAL